MDWEREASRSPSLPFWQLCRRVNPLCDVSEARGWRYNCSLSQLGLSSPALGYSRCLSIEFCWALSLSVTCICDYLHALILNSWSEIVLFLMFSLCWAYASYVSAHCITSNNSKLKKHTLNQGLGWFWGGVPLSSKDYLRKNNSFLWPITEV